MPTYAWVSPTGSSDPSAVWDNDANAYDGNLATYAHEDGVLLDYEPSEDPSLGGYYTRFLFLNLSTSMWIDKVRFLYGATTATNLIICVAVWDLNTSSWYVALWGKGYEGTQKTVTFSPVYTNQIRITLASATRDELRLYEVEAERVTPDPDVPVPPAQTTVVDTEEVSDRVSDKEVSIGLGARVRTRRRRTKLTPVVTG